MESLRQVFINNLKYLRKKKGLRQIDLALEIGKSSNYINSIENGKYFPSPETIEQIANLLEVEPMQIFDKNGCKENVINSNGEQFSEELTEKLYSKLKTDLHDFLRKDIFEALK